jgi:hypothetical protein
VTGVRTCNHSQDVRSELCAIGVGIHDRNHGLQLKSGRATRVRMFDRSHGVRPESAYTTEVVTYDQSRDVPAL